MSKKRDIVGFTPLSTSIDLILSGMFDRGSIFAADATVSLVKKEKIGYTIILI